MRICTNCGRILEDDEEICRVCNSDLILDTEGTDSDPEEQDIMSLIYGDDSPSETPSPSVSEKEVVSLHENQSSGNQDIDSDIGNSSDGDEEKSTDEESPESADETKVSADNNQPSEDHLFVDAEDLSSQAAAEEETDSPLPAEPSEELTPEDTSKQTNEPSPASEPAKKETRNEKIKIISVRAPNEERLPHVNRSRVLLVISALLVLSAVIFAVFMVVIPLIDARKQDEAARISAYMEFLEGKWLSETFIYSGQEFPSCEILVLNRNNTFSTEIMTSPNDRETYDPETWTVTAEQAGQFRLELETSSLRVSFDDGQGNTMVYRRYIIKLDSQSLVLREYYNEKMTEYYDVVFSRYS